MTTALDRLARSAGIEPEYLSLTGETQRVSDDAKRAVLRAMNIAATDEAAVAASLATAAPVERGPMQAPDHAACHVPGWLKEGRSWGIACQLYGLRSARNWGVGDFEDLARFAEIAAAAGADFVGVNPLHALFSAAPGHYSPFSPSNRQFLNPIYIAIDNAPGFTAMAEALDPPADIRDGGLLEYGRVAPLKLKALDRLFRISGEREDDPDAADFESFIARNGRPLYLHALFEALSQHMAERGHGPTWHGWPEPFRDSSGPAVRDFAAEQVERVSFHCWLQWLADRQLGEAQARARAAGMRIGLYLDLAVGVAADGSATWSDRELTVPGARIGAPPDYYNAAGQDWGLAPLSPAALVGRDFEPFREAMDMVCRRAGAIRIDHAMSLYRLFWIAEGLTAADGVYVRYPFARMLETLADVSQARGAIVIGEDLGVVPPGFRDVMRAMEIQSYRVFFFEKRGDHFIPPAEYPREALACVTTHDLHTLAGWWSGRDLEVRREIGLIAPEDFDDKAAAHAHDRRRLLGLLDQEGLLPPELAAVMRGEADSPVDCPQAVTVALHKLVARTPSRLFAVTAEDLVGATDQVNVPGTMDEHPNWRRKLPVEIEDLPGLPLFRAITDMLRSERPRQDAQA